MLFKVGKTNKDFVYSKSFITRNIAAPILHEKWNAKTIIKLTKCVKNKSTQKNTVLFITVALPIALTASRSLCIAYKHNMRSDWQFVLYTHCHSLRMCFFINTLCIVYIANTHCTHTVHAQHAQRLALSEIGNNIRI